MADHSARESFTVGNGDPSGAPEAMSRLLRSRATPTPSRSSAASISSSRLPTRLDREDHASCPAAESDYAAIGGTTHATTTAYGPFAYCWYVTSGDRFLHSG